MTAVKMKEQSLPFPKPAKEPIIDIIDSDSDGEEIQVTKVKLTLKQKTDNLIREAIQFYRQENYKSALEKLEAVFALDENNIMALVALGVNTYRLGHSDHACEVLTRALKLDPNHIDAITAKATILCNNDDIDGSLELLERGLKNYSKENNGSTLIEDAKYKKALCYYLEIGDTKAQNYLKDKNKQEAIKMYEKMIQFSPENIQIKKILVSLRRKASSNQNELICLSSDEDESEDVKEKTRTEISRDIFRDISDDDQEETQTNNSYKDRISQFLKNRSESNDLSENQKETRIVEKKTKIERISEEQTNKCQQNFSTITEFERININEMENSPKSPNCNNKKSDLIESHEVDNLNANINSPEKKSTNNETAGNIEYEIRINNTSMAPNENIEKIVLVKSQEDNNLQTNVNLENAANNDKRQESKESEISKNKMPRKRTLPKLKRLPIGYMVEKAQPQVPEEESRRIDQTQSQANRSNDKEINQSQADRSPDKKLRQSRIANNLYHGDMIENETENNGDGSNFIEYQNTEEALFVRGQNYEENMNLKKAESKTDRNNDAQSSKVKNTHETKDTQKSRKPKNVDKNIDKRKNKKEESVDIKSTSSEKHEISNKNSEKTNNEKNKNKKSTDISHQRSSKSSCNSSKHTPTEQKKKGKIRSSSKKIHQSDVESDGEREVSHQQSLKVSRNSSKRTPTEHKKRGKSQNSSKKLNQSDEESDVESDIFGVNANSCDLSGLDDLPDIETNHTEYLDQNEKDANTSEEEYDELRELQKDIERSTGIEDKKIKEKDTENQKRKGVDLSNVRSKTTFEFLERLRQENEKTEKTTNEMSNRFTRDIQRNMPKNNTPAKETDGRRAILLTDPIVPPSEIRKRRRRRNGNFHEDEEETPKKKYVRKSLNSESSSEAIVGPSNVQKTPILLTPVKEPSAEIRTPTQKPSSSKKETLSGPRGKSKEILSQVLCSRHASVRKEFKHLDEGDISDLAENIEAELYKLFNGDTGKEYKAKLRSLQQNINHKNNETLFRKILNRKVSPKMLVRMNKNELAPEELARWQEMREKQTLDAIVQTEKEKVNASNYQVILKNHKGDLLIQNDYGKEALETLSLNELPEDLSIDLNIKSSSGSKNKKDKKHKTSRR